MERNMGRKSVIESAAGHAAAAKAARCCGASENVVAKPGFRAHSEFQNMH
jgi:hypothetical protein